MDGTTLTSVARYTALHAPEAHLPLNGQRPAAVQLMLYFAWMNADKQLLSLMQELKPGARLVLNAARQASYLNAVTPDPLTVSMLEPAQCKQSARPAVCAKLGAGS